MFRYIQLFDIRINIPFKSSAMQTTKNYEILIFDNAFFLYLQEKSGQESVDVSDTTQVPIFPPELQVSGLSSVDT